MCDMTKRPPIFRKLTDTSGPITLEPAAGYGACALVEQATEGGAAVAWLRLYVSRNLVAPKSGQAAVTYTPSGGKTYWIVDFYDQNSIDLCAVMAAIVNGAGPGLPDPPPNWGTGTPN